MTIWNLGSINIDHFYRLPHLPAPGETLAADSYSMGLGGKGANQSVAAARAGARVYHIGGVGPEGWALERLQGFGVDCRHVERCTEAGGHAIINVDQAGENAIVLFAGANRAFGFAGVEAALQRAVPGDTLLLQNEAAHQAQAAELARAKGMRVIYSAAPFDVEAVRAVLPHITLLALNAVEAAQLSQALGVELDRLLVPQVLVTRGGDGAEWRDLATGETVRQAAFSVDVVDTTGAGDTFAGYFAAARDAGQPPAEALRLASAAAALKVTRAGTADAIPARAEVEAFLKTRA
ncbi:PfkB family carbohydrate kinase [Phaeovulum sp.]|uniref:PfkB family carbohydrate kinase n=1 Tax=Phaeovulum sp. TaxID=2934796 RepID=UPI003568F6D4